MLSFLMAKRLNLWGAKYLLYYGWRWRLMNSPMSTVYMVLVAYIFYKGKWLNSDLNNLVHHKRKT